MNFTGKRYFAKGGESALRHSLFYAVQILTCKTVVIFALIWYTEIEK